MNLSESHYEKHLKATEERLSILLVGETILSVKVPSDGQAFGSVIIETKTRTVSLSFNVMEEWIIGTKEKEG